MKHLPIEIVYEEYNNGATTIELSEKYNCSVTTIRKRLIKYCEQTGLEFKKGIDPKHTSYSDITHWPDRIPINQNSEKTENQE